MTFTPSFAILSVSDRNMDILIGISILLSVIGVGGDLLVAYVQKKKEHK